MKNKIWDNIGKYTVWVLFCILVVICLTSSISTIQKDECMSFSPLVQKCMYLNESVSIDDMISMLNTTAYLSNLEFRYKIINETLLFSMSKGNDNVLMEFKNNTNKIVRTGG